MPQAKRQQALKHSQVVLYGKCGNLTSRFTRASLLARNLGSSSTCLIIAPDPEDLELRFSILEKYVPNSVVNAQGVVLSESGQSAVIESCDCPTIVIEHLDSGNVGVLHVGREQLIDRHDCCQKIGVIERLIPTLGPLDGQKINAYITGGISTEYFEHKNPEYIKPFVELYGSEVVKDHSQLTLDLVMVIRTILKKYGVSHKNIKHDGLCTFTEPWLGSRRAHGKGFLHKEKSNWTIVVKQ